MIHHTGKLISSVFLLITISFSYAQKRSGFRVNFDFNKYELTTDAKASLDSFITSFHPVIPGTSIELFGHCDSIGSNAHNDTLSLNRVRAVMNYLSEKGIAPGFLVKNEGMGKRQPLNNNATERDRWLNRRVEIVVTYPEEKAVVVKVEKKEIESQIKKKIEDTATKAGTIITLKNLIFVGGMHTLISQSAPVLEELLDAMKKNNGLVISIEGHVCCLPGDIDGLDLSTGTPNLSLMRAKTVYDYLLTNGIAPERISYKGFGHSHPLTPYPEKTDEERSINRRVEIRIISK